MLRCQSWSKDYLERQGVEYRILVLHNRNVHIYRIYKGGYIRFWAYAGSIQEAVDVCSNLPTTIIVVSNRN